jgi:hypothetical protein
MEFIAGEDRKIGVVSRLGLGAAVGSRALVERAAILLTALVVAFGCFWSTAKFDFAVHEFALFQGAPDEPFYLSQALNMPFSLDYRFASRILIITLRTVGVTRLDWIALTYEAIFTPLAFFTAFVAARCLTSRIISRLALALCLCLAYDLLSGGSEVVANPPPALALTDLIGKDWLFHTDLWTCFPVFRRPEPQVSFCYLFLYFFGIVHSLGGWRPRAYRFLCLATPLTCLIYVSTALIALLVFGMASLAAALFYRRPLWRWFISTLVVTAIAYVVTFSGGYSGSASTSMVYATHLPMLRPSMLWSTLGVCLCVYVAWRQRWRVPPRLCLAFIFLMVPFCTLNQQIITGYSIMSQTWEVYGNYVCIVMAAGLVVPFLKWGDRLSQSLVSWLPAVVWVLVLAILVRGELRNQRFWAALNVQSMAHARVYQQAVAITGPVERVVLPYIWDDQLFAIRVKKAPPVLGAYAGLLLNPPLPWTSSESLADHLARNRVNVDEGFETLARRGLSVAAFRASLTDEVSSGYCWPTLMHFFRVAECAPLLTNFQSTGFTRLKGAVDPLADSYAEFLHRLRLAPSPTRVLVITYGPLPDRFEDSAIENHFVAKMTVTFDDAEVTTYAYLQTSS